MPQAVWTGSIAFGLVNIPVKLYNATSPRDIRFHQFRAGTTQRIRYRRVAEEAAEDVWAGMEAATARGPGDETEPRPARQELDQPGRVASGPAQAPDQVPTDPDTASGLPPATGGSRPAPPPPSEREVAAEEIVKGFELEPGRVVMVRPEEIERLAAERSRVIEIQDFVDLADIDPVYFEKSYYVVPQRDAERPYWLLLRTMQRAGKVGIASFVLRTKEYVAAIRPSAGILSLETLFYADEVRSPAEVGLPREVEPAARELDVAQMLVESLATAWEPDRYRDEYRERVMQLIRSRAGDALPVEDEGEMVATGTRVPDLMAALLESVEEVKRRTAELSEKQPQAEPKRRKRKTG